MNDTGKTPVHVQINTQLLDQLMDYTRRHRMSGDFVVGVALSQFLDDPDNHLDAVPDPTTGHDDG